jgi:hypothetical protein
LILFLNQKTNENHPWLYANISVDFGISATAFGQKLDAYTCTVNGKQLYGKVKVVEHFADYKVRVVSYNADLNVDTTRNYPSQCGEWTFVEHFEDFSIELVSSSADFTISYDYPAGITDYALRHQKPAINESTCTYGGIRLYGKVQVVTSFADIKVKVVESFADLQVEKVTSFPNDCGKWEFVESFPDFTIQFVDSFEDISIKFVDSFPGF